MGRGWKMKPVHDIVLHQLTSFALFSDHLHTAVIYIDDESAELTPIAP